MALKTGKEALITSIEATAELAYANRLVSYDGDYCGAGENPYGVLMTETADGEMAPVCLFGECVVESGGAFSKGEYVKSGANGKVVDAGVQSYGYIPVTAAGIAVDASTGTGQFVRIRVPA